MKDYSIL